MGALGQTQRPLRADQLCLGLWPIDYLDPRSGCGFRTLGEGIGEVLGETADDIRVRNVIPPLFSLTLDRSLTMYRKRVGYGKWMGLTQPDKGHRHQRKLATQQMGTNAAIARFHPPIELEVGHFLLHTLDRPDDLVGHLER